MRISRRGIPLYFVLIAGRTAARGAVSGLDQGEAPQGFRVLSRTPQQCGAGTGHYMSDSPIV